jgi:hypothetical protein
MTIGRGLVTRVGVRRGDPIVAAATRGIADVDEEDSAGPGDLKTKTGFDGGVIGLMVFGSTIRPFAMRGVLSTGDNGRVGF